MKLNRLYKKLICSSPLYTGFTIGSSTAIVLLYNIVSSGGLTVTILFTSLFIGMLYGFLMHDRIVNFTELNSEYYHKKNIIFEKLIKNHEVPENGNDLKKFKSYVNFLIAYHTERNPSLSGSFYIQITYVTFIVSILSGLYLYFGGKVEAIFIFAILLVIFVLLELRVRRRVFILRKLSNTL